MPKLIVANFKMHGTQAFVEDKILDKIESLIS